MWKFAKLGNRIEFRMYILKSLLLQFSGDTGKSAVLKASENSQKNIFSRTPFQQFELFNVPPINILKTKSTAKVSLSNPRIFKTAGRHLWWNQFQYSNRNFCILQLCPELYHVDCYVSKSGSSKKSQAYQPTGCNATKNKISTKFLKVF